MTVNFRGCLRVAGLMFLLGCRTNPDASHVDASAPAASASSLPIGGTSMPRGEFVLEADVEDFVISDGEILWITKDRPAQLRKRALAGGAETVLALVVRNAAHTSFVSPLLATSSSVLWFDDDLKDSDLRTVRAVSRKGGAPHDVLPPKTLPYPLVPLGDGAAVAHPRDLVLLGAGGAVVAKVPDVNPCTYASDDANLYFSVECGNRGVASVRLDGTDRRTLTDRGNVYGVSSEGPLLSKGGAFSVLESDGGTKPVVGLIPSGEPRRTRRRGGDLYVLGFLAPNQRVAGHAPNVQLLARWRAGEMAVVKSGIDSRSVFDVDDTSIYISSRDGVVRQPR